MTMAAVEQVQACVDREYFDTMENLLMTASPLFRDRFQASLYDKLDNAQKLQYPPLNYSNSMAHQLYRHHRNNKYHPYPILIMNNIPMYHHSRCFLPRRIPLSTIPPPLLQINRT
ncbi:unnamed protein product [Absidia cylindrospora]